MNDIITSCVDSRKNALMSTCNTTDSSVLEEIDNYFERLVEFANGCSDVADFESKFAISSLAQEYTDLFVKVVNGNNEEAQKESLASDIKDEFVDDVTLAVRRKAYQETYDKARDIPGVGEALNVKQHFDFFSRFKKKKDD